MSTARSGLLANVCLSISRYAPFSAPEAGARTETPARRAWVIELVGATNAPPHHRNDPPNKALELTARRWGRSGLSGGRRPPGPGLTRGRQPGEAWFLRGRAAAERPVR